MGELGEDGVDAEGSAFVEGDVVGLADVACVFAEDVLQLGVGVLFFAEGVGVGEGIGGYVAAGSVAADAVFGDDDVADVYLGVKGADGADEDGSAAFGDAE